MLPIGSVVCQRPRVKSGKSMGPLLFATDFSLNSVLAAARQTALPILGDPQTVAPV
jgi:hypothetical protein